MVWSTFEFDIKTKKVDVWMPRHLVEIFTEKRYSVGLFRTDTWNPAFIEEENLDEVVERGERWIDWQDRKEGIGSVGAVDESIDVDLRRLSIASLD